MRKKIVLKEVTLCAIVRDEKMNPAGGIQRFVESHVPFVEEAVIVDTGSIDGTREILEEMENKYPNLKIYDKKFKGFANARNHSLEKANAKYALVLDADELLTSQKPTNDWEIIQEELSEEYNIYRLAFNHILPCGNFVYMPSHNYRLFRNNGSQKYERKIFENLIFCSDKIFETSIKIKHFLPNKDVKLIKDSELYTNRKCLDLNPSQIEGFEKWKEYNPQRGNFI